MNVDEIQQQIHVLYEGDVDYPSNPSDEDFQIRLRLINLAIHEWEQTPNVLWRELIQSLDDINSNAAEKQVESGKNKYHCPDNLARMYEGVIYIDGLELIEIPIEKRQEMIKEKVKNVFYLSDNPSSGYYVNFLGVNTSSLAGKNMSYSYIKTAKQMISPVDIPECSDPNYIVHRVVSELYAQDGDPKSTKELQISQSLLSGMIVRNAATSIIGNNTY